MRAQRQEIKLLQEGEANEDDIIGAKVKYRITSDEYVRFSEAMNLPQQRERVMVDGLKNIGQIPKDKILKNAIGDDIIIVNKTTLRGIPNSITQVVNAKGGIDRNYYGPNGRQFKQISNNDHNKPKQHPFGVNGEHAHDYTYDENGKLLRGRGRELSDSERQENGDIL